MEDTDYKKYFDKNKNINRGFRGLDVWNEAIELFVYVKKKIDDLKTLSFNIKSQIEDSILSVSSNIAEGYCRRSIKENIQFLNFAIASLGGNYSQIYALFYSGEIDESWFQEYDSKHYKLENKLIKMNKTYIQKLSNNENWQSDYSYK